MVLELEIFLLGSHLHFPEQLMRWVWHAIAQLFLGTTAAAAVAPQQQIARKWGNEVDGRGQINISKVHASRTGCILRVQQIMSTQVEIRWKLPLIRISGQRTKEISQPRNWYNVHVPLFQVYSLKFVWLNMSRQFLFTGLLCLPAEQVRAVPEDFPTFPIVRPEARLLQRQRRAGEGSEVRCQPSASVILSNSRKFPLKSYGCKFKSSQQLTYFHTGIRQIWEKILEVRIIHQ